MSALFLSRVATDVSIQDAPVRHIYRHRQRRSALRDILVWYMLLTQLAVPFASKQSKVTDSLCLAVTQLAAHSSGAYIPWHHERDNEQQTVGAPVLHVRPPIAAAQLQAADRLPVWLFVCFRVLGLVRHAQPAGAAFSTLSDCLSPTCASASATKSLLVGVFSSSRASSR